MIDLFKGRKRRKSPKKKKAHSYSTEVPVSLTFFCVAAGEIGIAIVPVFTLPCLAITVFVGVHNCCVHISGKSLTEMIRGLLKEKELPELKPTALGVSVYDNIEEMKSKSSKKSSFMDKIRMLFQCLRLTTKKGKLFGMGKEAAVVSEVRASANRNYVNAKSASNRVYKGIKESANHRYKGAKSVSNRMYKGVKESTNQRCARIRSVLSGLYTGAKSMTGSRSGRIELAELSKESETSSVNRSRMEEVESATQARAKETKSMASGMKQLMKITRFSRVGSKSRKVAAEIESEGDKLSKPNEETAMVHVKSGVKKSVTRSKASRAKEVAVSSFNKARKSVNSVEKSFAKRINRVRRGAVEDSSKKDKELNPGAKKSKTANFFRSLAQKVSSKSSKGP